MTLKGWIVQASRKYIRFRMRSGRGSSFTAELTSLLDNATRAGAVTVLLDKYAHITLPWYVFPLLWVIQKVIEYNIGAWDEVHGTWKYENGYNAELNPYLTEMRKDIKEIKETIRRST